MRPFLAFVVAALIAPSCTSDNGGVAPATTAPVTTTVAAEPESPFPWWNERVFYEVFVRSFKDSDGDGIGDFAGLTSSLDYLNDGDPATSEDLGVTGIWLMPIFPSPSYHGYDVVDYRTVNPDYGTMEDFMAFLDAAHDRGIAVLIDLVINHTSSEHPWFLAAADGQDEFTDWYRWADADPGTISPWNGGAVWHPIDDRYYFGLFWEGMPDLDLENPATTAELYDITRFWLEDVGVDGFRLDAARHLIEDGATLSDTPATVAWLEEFTDFVHSIDPDALVLGEVWSPTEDVARYVPDALDLAFDFDLAQAVPDAIASGRVSEIDRALLTTINAYPDLQYATFLTNHDMNRIMSVVGGDVRVARLAATWLLTGPGVPFIYYGEEIGLQGTKPDEQIRTPMPWTAEEPGIGFTVGTPWQPPDPHFADINVAQQAADSDSLLAHYRALIQGRNASMALRRGEVIPVQTTSPAATAFLRSSGDDHVLVVLNVGPEQLTEVALNLATGPLLGMMGVTPLVGPEAHAPHIESGGFVDYEPVESIPPYGFLVLRFTPEPSPVPQSTTTTAPPPIAVATAADVASVEALFELSGGQQFGEASALLAPDAVVIDIDGSPTSLQLPVPPEAGYDETWDWDADGVVTVGDIVLAQNAWGSVIVSDLEHDCAPVAEEVVCEIRQQDYFGGEAGNEQTETTQSFRVTDGLIVELRVEQGGSPTDSGAELAWLEQFAAFEQWLADTHPDLYPVVFRDGCCAGTPDNLLFTVESISAQGALVPEWAASVGGP